LFIVTCLPVSHTVQRWRYYDHRIISCKGYGSDRGLISGNISEGS